MSATTSTSSAFPLATDQCTTDCGDGAGTANAGGTVDSEAGAGGTTDNTFALSNGAMIAIIVIVIVVALLGSMFFLDCLFMPIPKAIFSFFLGPLLTLSFPPSLDCYSLLHRQEEGVEGPRDDSQVGAQGCYCSDTAPLRVPELGQRRTRPEAVEERPDEG